MKTEQLLIDFTKPLVHFENNVDNQKLFDANVEHFTKQCKILYEALLRGERLTTTKALVEYGIGDLRRRVKDLIDNYGIPVSKETKEGRYKEYYIDQNDICNLIN